MQERTYKKLTKENHVYNTHQPEMSKSRPKKKKLQCLKKKI